MTVAYPTAGIAAPRLDAAPTCPCGTRAATREPFCAHCGRRVAVPTAGGLASVAATRALQFAVIVVIANAIVGGATFAVVYLVSDAARLTEAALGLELLRLLVIGSLVATAIRFGIRGLRETADGRLRRRGWAIAGLVVAGFFGLLVALSVTATAVLAVVLR